MKKVLLKIVLLLVVIAVTVFVELLVNGKTVRSGSSTKSVSAIEAGKPALTLVIDAGHGGVDGGAVSDGGVRESELNLDIAQRIDLLAGFFGVRTIMTRDSETIGYSEKSNTIHEKKVEDQKNRVSLVNSTENAVFISIHQNKYTSGGPFGAQALYAKTNGSEELAKSMQALLISSVNPKNYRAAARIPDSIYIMNRVACPAILIECGFLSNPNEEALLKTGEYRLKLAAVIAAGYLCNRDMLENL